MANQPPNNPYPSQGNFQGQPQPMYPDQSNQGDATGGVVPYKNPKALIAYYCSVFALIPCFGFILGFVAVILGFLGLSDYKKNPTRSGVVHAWVGIILGGFIVLAHIGAVGIFAYGIYKTANESPKYYRTTDEIPSNDGFFPSSSEIEI